MNGIRAAYRKGFMDWLEKSNPDILCLQEMRASSDQIPTQIREAGYFEVHHVAEKKGYSGVSIYSRNEPDVIEVGMGTDWIDQEGRVCCIEVNGITVFSVYAPSGTTGDLRQDVKMRFLDAFYAFASKKLWEGKAVLFCGDFNICHEEIDIHNPKQNKNTSGFLKEERDWVTSFLDLGYEDVFRKLHHGEPDLYSWWTYRAGAKAKNKGWRIDYHLATPALAEKATEATIEKEWDLSDHAPVSIIYDLG